MNHDYDVIVAGLGAMGSAALYQLAKRGVRVLGLDKYDPPHTFGSSHAETRITRLAVGEGPQYIPLVARTHEIWREIETLTGEQILFQSGGYVICPKINSAGFNGDYGEDFVKETADLADRNNIPHQVMTAEEIRAHTPMMHVQDSAYGVFEPTAGVVLSEKAVRLQLGLAQEQGAVIHTNEPLTRFEETESGVKVITEQGEYTAEKLILTTGGWLPDLLPEQDQHHFKLYRQVVYWFEAEDPSQFSTDHYPMFIWIGEKLSDYFSTFPIPPNGVPGVKMMTEEFIDTTTADTYQRDVSQEEISHFFETLVKPRMSGITSNCIKAQGCIYTEASDGHFVIDWHPAQPNNVLYASPCSGHGFKHSAAIGEMLTELILTGKSRIDARPFQLSRLKK